MAINISVPYKQNFVWPYSNQRVFWNFSLLLDFNFEGGNELRWLLHSVPRIVALITVCANTGVHVLMLVFTQLKGKSYFKVCALIFFWISTCEESSLPMKHSKKLSYRYFLLWRRSLMKAMILDTHGIKKTFFTFKCFDVKTILRSVKSDLTGSRSQFVCSNISALCFQSFRGTIKLMKK